MNRQIEFRGKRLDNGEWVYGFFSQNIKGAAFITLLNGDCFSVDPETVGQFIRVLDKNKTKIYEGDIFKGEYYTELHVVPNDFSNNCGECWWTWGWDMPVETDDDGTINREILGNRHDNPELIPKTEDNE